MERLWGSNVFLYLSKGLDASSLRQQVHANNLANVNTPAFKRSVVQFEEILKNAAPGNQRFAVTAPGHIGRNSRGDSGALVVKDTSTSMRTDGNNVDVDMEMAELAVNQLYYNALAQQLNDRLGMLRYVINEGRR